jgi:hypothetical protein
MPIRGTSPPATATASSEGHEATASATPRRMRRRVRARRRRPRPRLARRPGTARPALAAVRGTRRARSPASRDLPTRELAPGRLSQRGARRRGGGPRPGVRTMATACGAHRPDHRDRLPSSSRRAGSARSGSTTSPNARSRPPGVARPRPGQGPMRTGLAPPRRRRGRASRPRPNRTACRGGCTKNRRDRLDDTLAGTTGPGHPPPTRPLHRLWLLNDGTRTRARRPWFSAPTPPQRTSRLAYAASPTAPKHAGDHPDRRRRENDPVNQRAARNRRALPFPRGIRYRRRRNDGDRISNGDPTVRRVEPCCWCRAPRPWRSPGRRARTSVRNRARSRFPCAGARPAMARSAPRRERFS